MQALLEFAERTVVRNLVTQVTGYSAVQGVVVDYDPLWMMFWRLRCQAGERAVKPYVRQMLRWSHYAGELGPGALWQPGWWSAMADAAPGFDSGEIEPPNPSWLPPYWHEVQTLAGRPPSDQPFIVKVCLLPWQPEESLPELGEYPFFVVRERRAPAELALPTRVHRPVVGGVSIGTGLRDSGTLGGIVEDQNGGRWGLTCAHVISGPVSVDQPAQSDNAAAAPIGSGRHITQLLDSPLATPCNPYDAASVMNEVDATLIEFTPGTPAVMEVLQRGPLDGITPKRRVDPGMLVEMAGKQSGSRTLEVGGLGVTYRMRHHDRKLYCFHHLFELRWPRWWRVVGGRPVQRGDSGAWLIAAKAGGNEWAGVAMGSDRLVGYAVFAENITAWAQSQLGLRLRVV